MKDNELEEGLREWWVNIREVSKQARSQNRVWRVVREIVEGYGNWRNAPRGNPRKGYAAMKGKHNE